MGRKDPVRANRWYGKQDLRIEDAPEPQIEEPSDAIVRLELGTICGSDLHLYNGYLQPIREGYILGHEGIGEVVEVGPDVTKVRVGDRVVVPFPIACGECFFCQQGLFSGCERSNRNAKLAEELWGHSTCGVYGYSETLGGYDGMQAEYVRVPFANTDCFKIPEGLTPEQAVLLSDAFPTGFFAADNCEIKGGETIAVWGAGPIGQLATASAFNQGAGRVIVIDREQYRLDHIQAHTPAEAINYREVDDLQDCLKDLTNGRGPDAVIDAVGFEGHGDGLLSKYDEVKHALKMETDRPITLREAIMAVRNGGHVSIIGDYMGFADKIPVGSLMNRLLTVKTGQCPVQRYLEPLSEKILQGEIDPTFVISHKVRLEDVPRMYELWNKKEDGVIKVAWTP
jgi:threonine dehydrogenase-like Zn-dependent dehydrogenase